MRRTTKRCHQCKETKPISEWPKNKSRHDGVGDWCRTCENSMYRLDGKYGATKRKGRQKYYASLKGSLRRHTLHLVNNHGIDENTAQMFSCLVFHPDTRCIICGLKESQRMRLSMRGFSWIMGIGRRLSVDHIIPNGGHGWANLRVLCCFCNSYRGPALFSDHQVLAAAHVHWYSKLGHNYVRSWITTLVFQKGGLDEVPVHIG